MLDISSGRFQASDRFVLLNEYASCMVECSAIIGGNWQRRWSQTCDVYTGGSVLVYNISETKTFRSFHKIRAILEFPANTFRTP